MDDLDPKFVRKREGLHAQVHMNIKPKYKIRNKKDIIPDSSQHTYHKVTLKIPDEYAFALMGMCNGRGLQYAVMDLIRRHVTPLERDGQNLQQSQ